jgi:hypothetical protein
LSVLVVRFNLAEDARGGGAEPLFSRINELITLGTAFVHKNGGTVYSF